MVFDDNEASRPLPDLLIDKLPAEKPSAPALSLFQIQRIQSLLASTSEEFSSDDKSSISSDRLDFLDAPPLVDGDLPNNDYDVGEEERMFEQAKMYTDRGNGCFTNKEILSSPLLGIMRLRNKKPLPPPSVTVTLLLTVSLNNFPRKGCIPLF
jgi:hypothetical protein